jgi:hypothetical protein
MKKIMCSFLIFSGSGCINFLLERLNKNGKCKREAFMKEIEGNTISVPGVLQY